MEVTWLGFAPDLDPRTPGVMSGCTGLVPTLRGFSPRPSATALYPAMAAPALGEAFLAQYLNGTTRLFAGTATHLYEFTNGTTVTEVDGGTVFSGGAWRFAMFGNDCIATNGTNPPQVVGTVGNFANLGGTPPNAPIVETVYGFTLLFESNNWHGSKLGADNVWSNSSADLSATGQLLDTPGSITAARKLGTAIMAYKQAGIWVGQFVNLPTIWSWTLIDPRVGCAGQGCVVPIGGGQQAFVGMDDFYTTNGISASPIPGPGGRGPNPVKEWFFKTANVNYLANIEGLFDVGRATVHWFFSSLTATTAGAKDSVISWNMRTNKWTTDKIAVQAVVKPYTQTQTSWSYDTFDNTYLTYDGIPDLPYDSNQFFGSGLGILGYIDTTNIMRGLSGTPVAASITSGDIGDNHNYQFLHGVRPRFAALPISSTVSVQDFHRRVLGSTLTTGDKVSMDDYGYLSVRESDAFHRLQFTFTGDFEMIGFDADIDPDGEL